MPNGRNATGWVGWVYFAGILLILRGISQAFLGITALVNKHYLFTTANNSLVVTTSNMSAWGWVDLAIGVLVLAVGFSVLHGSTWARIFAVFFTGLSFLINMAFLGVFPVWSIVAMIVDVFVIYALIVHGDEAAL
ncbi:MAG TPA: hypothetical protein VHA05_03255 [Candidatus Saccharimonadales bacterium]|nr:hypothetical protein [Candidatus Saccharimonadales bacterium]